MGRESRLQLGRVVGEMAAVTSLMRRGEECGVHDLMDNGNSTVDWLCDQGF